VEILKSVSIDWLGKKWYFIAASLVLLVIGTAAYLTRGGLAYGIDFTGGTIIYLKFDKAPDVELIRKALKPEAVGTTIIQRYGQPEDNSVVVRMQSAMEVEQGVGAGQKVVRSLLMNALAPQDAGRMEADFNAVALESLAEYLKGADPDNLKAQNKTVQESDDYYQSLARRMLDYRDRVRDGLLTSLDELGQAPGISPQAVAAVKKGFFTAPFAVKGVESVGAIVGSDLRRRATLAVGLSLMGMLVYIAFRFKPIYGVAAIIALAHDVAITLGLFAVTQKEISLTVIAALLTLVGYSVNDTIVVFDRVRENLRLYRKESLTEILNLSINQTLSRTIMTSGMTFIAVASLFVFGGEVLNGFSFALTVGIIIGTYSSIAIASPIVDAWYRYRGEQKPKRKAA
jgi:preprotein translocase subunit SecF